jgi:hypothetical protein
MVKLVHEPRPPGKSTEYRFVRNDDSGRRFKVKHELRAAPDGSPALALTISTVDADNKSLPNGIGVPDVSSVSHTLTKVELQDPNFDPEPRVALMLEEAIATKERELNATALLQRLSAKWVTDVPFALDKRPA